MTASFADVPEPTIYVGVPFSGAAAMPGDVTGDGVVGIDDLLAVLAAWGSCAERVCPADGDGDGLVGASDLLIVLGNWSN